MIPEVPVVFDCGGDRLPGILHPAALPRGTGLVIVVGGPQYRVGSHRQFVLMARACAAAGVPTLRFDYRGMGDAEGEVRAFFDVNDDIRAAVDCLMAASPQLQSVALLGLCDAASAVMIYAATDPRVSGQILLNPWVRSEQGEARSYLRHYYLQRVMQKAFWAKVFRGEFKVGRSLLEFLGAVKKAGLADSGPREEAESSQFVAKMLSGLRSFAGPVLFVISTRDLTAGEFTDLCSDDEDWHSAVSESKVMLERVEGADHTLSQRRHLDYVNSIVLNWLNKKL